MRAFFKVAGLALAAAALVAFVALGYLIDNSPKHPARVPRGCVLLSCTPAR